MHVVQFSTFMKSIIYNSNPWRQEESLQRLSKGFELLDCPHAFLQFFLRTFQLLNDNLVPWVDLQLGRVSHDPGFDESSHDGLLHSDLLMRDIVDILTCVTVQQAKSNSVWEGYLQHTLWCNFPQRETLMRELDEHHPPNLSVYIFLSFLDICTDLNSYNCKSPFSKSCKIFARNIMTRTENLNSPSVCASCLPLHGRCTFSTRLPVWRSGLRGSPREPVHWQWHRWWKWAPLSLFCRWSCVCLKYCRGRPESHSKSSPSEGRQLLSIKKVIIICTGELDYEDDIWCHIHGLKNGKEEEKNSMSL